MKLSPEQIAQSAHSAGFRDNGLVIAVCIALAESGGNTTAINSNPPTAGCESGSTDRGLWQINNCYHAEVSDQCAYNAECSAAATYRLSNGGNNWNWWSTYTNGAYRSHLQTAMVAAAKITHKTIVPKPKQRPWKIELHPWTYRSQITMPVQAGYPATNRYHDCGPASLSMCIEYLRGIYISEDKILDTEYWSGYQGDTTDVEMIHYLNTCMGIPTYETIPKDYHHVRYLEWCYLRLGHPIIELGWLDTPQGRVGHFRCCTGISVYGSIMANPATGNREFEGQQAHWISSQRAFIALIAKR